MTFRESLIIKLQSAAETRVTEFSGYLEPKDVTEISLVSGSEKIGKHHYYVEL